MDVEIALLLAAPLVLAVWAAILMKWRWGVWGLVAYTPVTGLVIAAMYPSPLGTLVRDILVTLPLYISFFLIGKQARFSRIPTLVYCAFGALVLVVMFAAANPAVPSLMVAGIGAKVWLLYLPLLIVGATFIRDEGGLRGFLRVLVVSAWIPWAVGIIQFLGCTFYGYRETMEFFFGDYAANATQNFSAFDSYGATLYRIPSTFQFVTQYSVFCFFMLFPILMLLEIERDRRWRSFVWLSMIVGLIAGFTSGARGNFIFMPLAVMMVQFFKFRAGGLIQGVIGVGGALIAALSIGGIDGAKMYGGVADLTSHYGHDIAVGGLIQALDRGGLLGLGVGANTGAARHGVDPAVAMIGEGGMIENYYGKAIVELGAVGFLVVLASTGLLLFACLQIQLRLKLRPLKGVASCGTAMIAFLMLVSFKGWALDTDPLNYYYYLLLGMVFALPHVERQQLAAVQRSASMATLGPGQEAPAVPGEIAAADGLPEPEAVQPGPSRLPSGRALARSVPGGRGGENFLGPRLSRPAPVQETPPVHPSSAPDDDFELGPRLRRPAPHDTPG